MKCFCIWSKTMANFIRTCVVRQEHTNVRYVIAPWKRRNNKPIIGARKRKDHLNVILATSYSNGVLNLSNISTPFIAFGPRLIWRPKFKLKRIGTIQTARHKSNVHKVFMNTNEMCKPFTHFNNTFWHYDPTNCVFCDSIFCLKET